MCSGNIYKCGSVGTEVIKNITKLWRHWYTFLVSKVFCIVSSFHFDITSIWCSCANMAAPLWVRVSCSVPLSQRRPVKPWGHMHEAKSRSSWQVPPFKHESLVHSLRSAEGRKWWKWCEYKSMKLSWLALTLYLWTCLSSVQVMS